MLCISSFYAVSIPVHQRLRALTSLRQLLPYLSLEQNEQHLYQPMDSILTTFIMTSPLSRHSVRKETPGTYKDVV